MRSSTMSATPARMRSKTQTRFWRLDARPVGVVENGQRLDALEHREAGYSAAPFRSPTRAESSNHVISRIALARLVSPTP